MIRPSDSNQMVFHWDNFAPFFRSLLGEDAELGWEAESELGHSYNVSVNDANCVGRIEFHDLREKLKIIIVDCVWSNEQQYRICDGDWIRFNFSLSIDMQMRFADDEAVQIVTPSWRIINNPPDKEVLETIPSARRAAWVTVCCKKDLIEAVTGDDYDNLPLPVQEALTLNNPSAFHEFHALNSRLNAITADVLLTDLTGTIRITYIESRCMELICHALNFLINTPSSYAAPALSDKDTKSIEEAYALLIDNLAKPPSVSELSRQLGINRNKLFYGFKTIYGKSVSELVQEQRLEEGKRLLQQSEMPILDIAAAVGFRHQSNFATAMRRRFGLTPKQFRS